MGLTFLVVFLTLLGLLAVVPQLLARIRVPRIVGMLAVGIVIGPNCLDLMGRLNALIGRGYPSEHLYATVEALGLLGLIFLMTLAGMEIDSRLVVSQWKSVALFSVLSVGIPALIGFVVYTAYQAGDTVGAVLYAALFAPHSVAVVYTTVKDLHLQRSRFGSTLLATALVADTAGLTILAVAVQMKRHADPGGLAKGISVFDRIDPAAVGPSAFFGIFALAVLAYIALSLWIVPIIGHGVLRGIRAQDDMRMTYLLVVVLGVVILGEFIGVNVIIGAFVAGMAFGRVEAAHEDDHILRQKVESAGFGVFIPFFFLTAGMKTDPKVALQDFSNITLVLTTVLALAASKAISGWCALRLAGFEGRASLSGGLLTVPMLSATLAGGAVGVELLIIEPRFYNAAVVLCLVTTLFGLTLARPMLARHAHSERPQ